MGLHCIILLIKGTHSFLDGDEAVCPHPGVTAASSAAPHGAPLLVGDEARKPGRVLRGVQESTSSERSHEAANWVAHPSLIGGKYFDQSLRVAGSDLKVFLPPLFSIDQK